MIRKIRKAWFIFSALLLSACTVGPSYNPPAPPMPLTWQETAPWRPAEPRDAVPRGAWWTVFGDPALNRLEEQAMAANPGLQIALSRVAQARAALGFSRADRVPRIDLGASAFRSRTSADFSRTGEGETSTFIDLPVDLGYEIDLWGRVRNSVETAAAEAEASAADYHSARLSLQTEVARLWFTLRALDSESLLLRRAIELREENLQLVRSRFEAGDISKLDLNRAETELAAAEADVKSVLRSRAALVHALAVLTGQPASGLAVASNPLDLAPPSLVPGLPSTLLERRPDVAAAERRMAAANARIGVAHAAFFPAVTLFGTAGFQSTELSDLFSWDNHTWALGPAVSLPLFDGGRNRANLRRSEAFWNETAADYRATVLAAIGEVEDGLSGLRYLSEEADSLEKAVTAAEEAAELSRKRYRAGMVSYLEVVDAERGMLQYQRQAVRVLGLQLETSAFLIKALGGGWDEGEAGQVALNF
ncbi:efflux transporter outer membrane subunit [Desulfuromonas sp. TF]|uniref:efflux transporter outer membrane subunit n=1 Tax=Desulfuromonas sp. TF TaxID=1232410 RepID=UPI0004205AB4|nr:efflux transporter outer membrane subunit [Desulfuromonas sp. TF]